MQRAPRRAVALSLLVIVALAVPVLSMRVGAADSSSDPAGSSTRAYYDVMSDGFGRGFDAPLLLVAQAPDAASQQALAKLATGLPSASDVASVTAPAAVGRALR